MEVGHCILDLSFINIRNEEVLVHLQLQNDKYSSLMSRVISSVQSSSRPVCKLFTFSSTSPEILGQLQSYLAQ